MGNFELQFWMYGCQPKNRGKTHQHWWFISWKTLWTNGWFGGVLPPPIFGSTPVSRWINYTKKTPKWKTHKFGLGWCQATEHSGAPNTPLRCVFAPPQPTSGKPQKKGYPRFVVSILLSNLKHLLQVDCALKHRAFMFILLGGEKCCRLTNIPASNPCTLVSTKGLLILHDFGR